MWSLFKINLNSRASTYKFSNLEKGLTNKDLLANHYQHQPQVCLTAGTTDKNSYCPVAVNSSRLVSFSAKFTYLFTQAANLQKAHDRGWGRSTSLWRPAIYVCFHSWHQDLKQMFIGLQNFSIVTPFPWRIL